MISAFRKLLLVGLSVAVIAGLVAVYGWIYGPENTAGPRTDGPVLSIPGGVDDIKRVGRAERELEQGKKLEYYRRGPGGRLEREYYAERFWLETEDTAILEDVRLVWHMQGGQRLTLTSQSGRVHIERGAMGRMQPTRGLLTGNVRIVLDMQPNAERWRKPLGQREYDKLVITTNDLDFDTRSCQLWTERAVQIRAADLDADGAGLLLRWRQISREIDALIIQHGGELTWRGGQGRGFARLVRGSDEASEGEVVPVAAEKDKASGQVRTYRATFEEEVRVTYKDQVLHNVDELAVLFDLKVAGQSRKDSDKSAETTKQRPDRAGSEEQPAELAAPLHLTWIGKLTIRPSEQDEMPLAKGRRLGVEAVGKPVRFYSRDMSGSCANLRAQHQTGIVRLFGNDEHGVLFDTNQGSTIRSEQVQIDPAAGTAQMFGKGNLESKSRADQTGGKTVETSRVFDLRWDLGARLKFEQIPRPINEADIEKVGGVANDYYLSEATASENVVAVSQQFRLSANQMQMKLGPPGSDGTETGQAIKSLRAWDDFASVLGTNNLRVSAESMQTSFSRRGSGKGQFASAIKLWGDVQAIHERATEDVQSTLECDELSIELSERKERGDLTDYSQSSYGGEITNLQGQGNVIGRYLVGGEVRSSLSAHKLIRVEKSKTTTLYGDPAELRRGADDSLKSSIIRIVQKGDDYVLSTPASGQMQTSFESSGENMGPAMMGLKWPGSMEFDAQANRAVFKGTEDHRVTGAIVHSRTHVSRLAADELELFFGHKEPASGSVRELSDRNSDDSLSVGTFVKPIGERRIEKMILTGKNKWVQVRSIQHPANNPDQRVRGVLLKSKTLTYQADLGHFHGDGPGQLLLEDNRPTDEQILASQAKVPPGTNPVRPRRRLSLERVDRGQTAFLWSKESDYYQEKDTVVLTGSVNMVSRGYALTLPSRITSTDERPKKRHRTELWCEQLRVSVAPAKEDGTDQDKAAFADLSAMDELEFESVQALGTATLLSNDVNIEGDEIAYNTKTNKIQIKGSRKRQATLIYSEPGKGFVKYSGKKVIYDTLEHKGEAPGGRVQALY